MNQTPKRLNSWRWYIVSYRKESTLIEKNTQHKFETNAVVVELTEYPFHPGEEFHLSIKPNNTKRFECVELMGSPSGEQTLYLSNSDFSGWIKADEGLIDMIETALKQYRKGWRDLNKKMNTLW